MAWLKRFTAQTFLFPFLPHNAELDQRCKLLLCRGGKQVNSGTCLERCLIALPHHLHCAPVHANGGRRGGAGCGQQAEPGGSGGKRAHQEDWSDWPSTEGQKSEVVRFDTFHGHVSNLNSELTAERSLQEAALLDMLCCLDKSTSSSACKLDPMHEYLAMW